MKGFKKLGASILAVVLSASMLAGCAGGNAGGSSAAPSSSTVAVKEIKATDYVLAFHKYICTGDKKVIEDVKMQKDVVDKLVDTRGQMDNVDQFLKENLDEEALEMIDKEAIKEFVSTFTDVLSKVEATAKEESSSGDVVTVTISSDYIDLTSLIRDAAMGAIAGLDLGNIQESDVMKAADKIVKAFTDGLKDYKFPSDKRTATVELKKDGDTWQFVDLDEGAKEIISTIINAER